MTDLIEKARKFAALAEKATPGPWEWEGPFLDSLQGDNAIITEHGASYMDRNDLKKYSMTKRLIAAAPEMAELLGEMADRLERLSTLLETKERIQFYCPECGGTLAILESGALMAPWEGTIRCENCGRLWKVQLVEAGDNE